MNKNNNQFNKIIFLILIIVLPSLCVIDVSLGQNVEVCAMKNTPEILSLTVDPT